MKIIIPAIACVCLFYGSAAMSESIPEVQKFIEQEITKMASSPIVDGLKDPNAPALDGSYALSLFRLRVKAEVGFDVGVGKVTLEPYAEFFWE